LVICQVLEPGDKITPIFGVEEDLPSFNTPAHDMMEYPGGLPKADKRLSEGIVAWHYLIILSQERENVKHVLHERALNQILSDSKKPIFLDIQMALLFSYRNT
jgi:hypothetical protein